MSTTRRWWLRATAPAATVVVLLLATAAPAVATVPGQYWLQRLTISKAWTVTKGAGAVVAVVDSGVDADLGDLRGQVLPGKDFSGSGDGRSDPGESCGTGNTCSHGTDMALYIAGTGKGLGYQGVAPGAKILPVKISAGAGADFTPAVVAQGIRWAVDQKVDVVSVSLGTSGDCDPDEAAAAKYAYQHDVLVVSSAGNTGAPVTSPANCPGVIAVGGIDQNFKPWSLTNYGPETDFVGAADNLPQETLQGTRLVGASGTSGAAAIVAATFALMRAHTPDLSIEKALRDATNNVHNGLGDNAFGRRIDDKLGYGEILPYYAMTFAIKANAPNPIWTSWQKALGPQSGGGSSGGGSSSAVSTAPSTAASSAPSSAPATQPASTPAITAAADSGSGGGNTGLIVGIVVAVVVIGGAVGVVVARSRRGGARA